MANSIYRIVVREPSKGELRLYNDISNEVAGARFRKGTPKVNKGKGKEAVEIHWPFKNDKWMVHATQAEAVTAAKKLQEYLDACEGTRSKTKKKTNDKLEFDDETTFD